MFADDTLTLCNLVKQDLLHLRCVLSFKAVSSLRVNLGKSELIPVGGD